MCGGERRTSCCSTDVQCGFGDNQSKEAKQIPPRFAAEKGACVGRVVYSAGLICTGITRGLTSVVRVKASAIAATSAPSNGSC